MFGLLAENGPYSLSTNLTLVPRAVTWNEHYAMLYIDNPVGVGFSFVDTDQGYSRTETEVAQNLYTALTAFFAVYTSYADNDFYITGESYAYDGTHLALFLLCCSRVCDPALCLICGFVQRQIHPRHFVPHLHGQQRVACAAGAH
jgi:hypothetical protein